MEVKCPEMILIQDSSFKMGSYTIKDFYMSLKAHADFGCSSLDMTFQQRDILALIRPWSLYQEISGGHKCGKPSKIMSQHVTFVPLPRFLDIAHTDYYVRFQFQRNHGLPYPWIL
jgi:hypothetical protein